MYYNLLQNWQKTFTVEPKVTSQVATPGPESAVYDCPVVTVSTPWLCRNIKSAARVINNQLVIQPSLTARY